MITIVLYFRCLKVIDTVTQYNTIQSQYPISI